MSLLQAARVGFQYSLLEPLFHDVTFDIDPGDRIALVGPNGAGKTTLLRILSGGLEPDHGMLARRRGMRVAVLNQVRDITGDGASAGQRTQEALARCLASDADLLLLDEPTNHLDVAARRWLARELASLPAASVVVSHDRAFLDDVATRVFEIERGSFTVYNGGYGWYEHEREVRAAAQRAAWESQQRRFAALDRAAERRSRLAVQVSTRPEGQRDARGGKPFYAAKAAKVARTARMIRERKEDEPRVDKPWESEAIPALTFVNVPRASDPPLELIGVGKAYDGRTVFAGLNLQCRRGDRWALIGANGCGKTTLFRLLLGLERPDEGEIRVAPNVRFAYYAQEAENLDPRRSAVEICGNVCADRQWIRTLLACLKLPRVLADQPVGQLSPGERAKVGLARVLVEGANVLLLDEPTNHLEVEAQEALEATLRHYPGTILLVSHDRRFVDRFANRLFEF